MTTRITDVRVFDGEQLLPDRKDVTFDATGIIAIDPAGTNHGRETVTDIDGSGATLLPGLWTHTFIYTAATLFSSSRASA